MNNIKQERANEDPILNVIKKEISQSLNKKFVTHVEIPIYLQK